MCCPKEEDGCAAPGAPGNLLIPDVLLLQCGPWACHSLCAQEVACVALCCAAVFGSWTVAMSGSFHISVSETVGSHRSPTPLRSKVVCAPRLPEAPLVTCKGLGVLVLTAACMWWAVQWPADPTSSSLGGTCLLTWQKCSPPGMRNLGHAMILSLCAWSGHKATCRKGTEEAADVAQDPASLLHQH